MSGFRVLPHVADLIVEAWGTDPAACLAAAVEGLVSSFADPHGATPDRRVDVSVAADRRDELVVRLLEEVIFLLDTEGRVPVRTVLRVTDGGGVRGWFDTVAVDVVEQVGALPKGVSRTDVELGERDAPDGRQWHCRVIVDV